MILKQNNALRHITMHVISLNLMHYLGITPMKMNSSKTIQCILTE